MPEGPECRIIGEWLKNRLFTDGQAAELTYVGILSGRYIKPGAIEKIRVRDFYPRPIIDVKVHGKFIYMVSETHHIGFTLGMTGNFSPEPTKYARLRFTFGSVGDIFFTDIRNFGTVKLLTQKQLERKLAYLGLDPLQQTIDFRDMATLLTLNGTLTLTEFLMDQRLIAGIGNYLKAEILWHAKLSPHRLAGTLSADEVNSLASAINKVPRMSFENQGASIRNYVTPSQAKGRFSELFEVYQRKTDRDGQIVVKQPTRDHRSTYWVPTRQR